MHQSLKDALLLVTSAAFTEVAFRGIPDGGRRRRPGACIVFGSSESASLFYYEGVHEPRTRCKCKGHRSGR
jgi:hypothetical protein